MDIFTPFNHEYKNFVARLAARLTSSGKMMGTAESCTGGLIAALLTSVPGSSNWFKGSVVAYSNEVKEKVLGADPVILEKHGAVSEETAIAMAGGARKLLNVYCALAVTGIAGPGGGTPEKEVGTVCFAWDLKGELSSETEKFTGSREQVREKAARHALDGLLCRLEHF